jgi:N-acetylmuramate 1-kinase
MTMKNFCTGSKGTAAAIEKQYKSVLDALVQWQSIPVSACAVIASRDLDLDMFLWESDYFETHCVREFFGLEKLLGTAWDMERRRIAAEAAALPKVCIHRDFQSENILLRDKRVRFVDYQGARRGPASYDVASLLYDPYIAKLSPALSKRLFEYYLTIAPAGVTERSYFVCSLQRLMQALGAYGNLSIHKGRERYRAFIPVALRRLATAIGKSKDVPALKGIVEECLAKCGAGQNKG